MTAAHARPTPARRAPRKQRTRPSIVRVVVAGLAMVVFGTTAFQFVGRARLDATVSGVAALDPDPDAVVDAAGQAGDENVLVLGHDPSASESGGPRTDTVLLAHVPAGGGDVVGVAIPRDLEVNRPPCERFDPVTRTYLDDIVPAQARTPLISAFDLGGPRCATRVVQQLTGLAVTQFVGVDLDGIGELVDAVGGVDVCVERPVLDSLLGAVVPEAGTSALNGLQARDLAQARTVDGDPAGGRGVLERQERLVGAVLEKVLSRETLLDAGRVGALGSILAGTLTTDGTDLDRILATARTLRSFAVDGVTFAAVPTVDESSGQGNTVLLDEEAGSLFAALRAGQPVPEQTVRAAAGGPVPQDVTVQILNASDRSGLAAEVGDTLGTLGFGIGELDNAPTPTPQTVIRFSPDRSAAADLLAETVPSATTVPDPGSSGVLQLVLGRSFDDVIRATAAPTPTPDGPAATCP